MRGLKLEVRVLVAVAVLSGCAGGEPIRDWTLDVEGGPHGVAVTLPSRLLGDLPLRDAPYTLRTTIPLRAEQRGVPLTLALACFHGELGLTVDHMPIDDLGDDRVGEHRYVIPAALTAGTDLPLELSARTSGISIGFNVEPRLSIGVASPNWVATFDRYLAVIECTVIGVFCVLFATLFAHDRRRREDLAFVIGAGCTAVAPLWQLGIIRSLGAFGPTVVQIALCTTNVAVLYFLHYGFQLPRPPRYLVAAYGTIAVASLGDALSFKIGFALNVAWMATGVLFVRYIFTNFVPLVRAGPRRGDARVLLITFIISALLVIPDAIGLVLGRSIYGGLHTISFGVMGFCFAQALVLSRQHVARARELERNADELRRQVAERSRELSTALAQLSQQPVIEVDRTIDGRYRVIRKLGAGGMGAVYEVERSSDHQRLALKTLRGRTDPDVMARFAREAEIAARIDHPNLVPVVDVGLADGTLFLVMPLVDGGSLEQARARFGDARWALPLLAQVAAGLAALHERGIVHRDLKPANVLLAGGVARIADFGLASLRHDATADTVASDSSEAFAATAAPLTRAGDLFGTPGYMAPELAGGVDDPKPATDMFAFGVLAFEMLTGRAPFAEPPMMARLAGRAITPPDVTGIDPTIARCLDLDPAKRPTAVEIAALRAT